MNQQNNVKPKIWHIGGEDVSLRIPLLLALRERGFQVGAVGSQVATLFQEHQIDYFAYDLAREINPLADQKTKQQLTQLFQQHQPDLIHGFDTKPALIAPVVAQKSGIKGRVRTITGMGYVFSSNSPLALTLRPIYRYLQKRADQSTQITIFQNPDDQNYFLENNMVTKGKDALVLSSGIDIEKFLQSRPDEEQISLLKQELNPENKLVVTLISRLVVTKGIREYLQAARMVKQKMENVVFLLVGPIASEGKQAIAQAEIDQYGDVVNYLGVRRDVSALLSISDLFVLPSYYREGIPRVLLEAGAMNLPLITTNMPGCKEVVKPDVNGLLIPPQNVPQLAQAILKVLASETDRKMMGHNSAKHIQENFTLTQVADAYAQIYRSVLAMDN
jgi:glycosyltransferase involved in cell wall biosynthesis